MLYLCPEWCITRIRIIRAKRVSNSHLRYTAIKGYIQKNKTVTVVVITGEWCVAKKETYTLVAVQRTPPPMEKKKRKKKEVSSIQLANFDWIV